MLEVLLQQRACRRFTDEAVEEADLAAMLEAATHAPSPENSQPWVFVVVRDAARRAAISEVSRAVWAGGGRAHAEASAPARVFADVDEFIASEYGGAPVLVVVAGDGRGGTSPALLASGVYPATQNLLLAAASLGYGSAMTTLAAYAGAQLAEVVGLPEGVRPFAIVPIGRPAARLGPPRRRPVSEVAHAEVFGTPFTAAGEPPPAPPPS